MITPIDLHSLQYVITSNFARARSAGTQYQAILVPSCDLQLERSEVYDDDENWKAINYLMSQWYTGSYSGAIWVDIQQVVWYYADDDYEINDQFPKVSSTSYINDVIIPDVDANWEQYEGPPCAMILVHSTNPGGHQLIFFMVLEIPLGTISAGLTLLSAFIVKRKRSS